MHLDRSTDQFRMAPVYQNVEREGPWPVERRQRHRDNALDPAREPWNRARPDAEFAVDYGAHQLAVLVEQPHSKSVIRWLIPVRLKAEDGGRRG
jgi:hypothetical protein